jgi:DNA-directed RNA polymerase subunit F
MKEKTTTKYSVLSNTRNLPSIYIPKPVSDDRKAWFNKNKYNVLNQTAQSYGALSEIQELYLSKAGIVSDFIDKLLNDSIDGLRIYFCSRGIKNDEDEIEDQDNCGRFNFIFASTVNGDDYGDYYSYKKKSKKIELISIHKARKWVKKYQIVDGKRDRLSSTLTSDDQNNKCFETKHVWFDKTKITELKNEIIEHLKRDIKAGLKIKLVSYTDEKEVDGVFGQKVPQIYQQRLTIDFVFTDKGGDEVYMDEDTLVLRTIATIYNIGQPFIDDEDIWEELFSPPYNKTKLDRILEELSRDKYKNWKKALNDLYTMDTGDPTPPPSSGNKEGLDTSDE